MPSVILNNQKTVWVDEDKWTSPDGKVTIWTIKLEDENGERGVYSTMSKNIAHEGWGGDIELYTNDKGKEYVRQAPKEEQTVYGQSKQVEYEPGTNARWAIGMAYRAFIQVMGTPEDNGGEFPFDAVLQHATGLVDMFERVKDHIVNKTPTGPQNASDSPLRRGFDKSKVIKSARDTFGDDIVVEREDED